MSIFSSKKKFTYKALAYSAMCLAIAVFLSYIKPFQLPNGGSPTFCSMFFVSIIGFWFGPVVGFTSAVAYGLLQLVVKPEIYHPVQVFLDYILAFGALGISGFLTKKREGLYIGFILGCFLRFLICSLSGYLFFASFTPEGHNPILYSLGYNASYIFLEMALTLIIILLPPVRSALNRIKNSI